MSTAKADVRVIKAEKERLDAVHHMLYDVALEGRLHVARLRALGPRPLRVLDVGYGTGIWAIEMKQRYPQAEVVAIDIGNEHPVFENYDFQVDFRSGVDFTAGSWGQLANEEGTYDFIHAGNLCGSVPDWPVFYRKLHRYV